MEKPQKIPKVAKVCTLKVTRKLFETIEDSYLFTARVDISGEEQGPGRDTNHSRTAIERSKRT